ncbi:TonB C-terminal domain-containing protein [Sulfurimonas sp. MAG313]|nr:TonB C-terminal domain-containing protein [Sulfurimonas sp. MAG313]MDF1881935.1 TonB C-terminal domain-containing protein [Sulfurimonas sp. MAG313]
MPTRNNDYYFYLGAIVSFSLFLSFCFLFIVFIKDHSRIKHIQTATSDYISINLNTVPSAKPIKVNKSKQVKTKKEEPEKVLETLEIPKKINTDLSSLFGEVKTKKLVKRSQSEKSEVDEKFLKKIIKRIQTKDTKLVKSTQASSLVKNLKLSKQHIKIVGDSTGVVDEYLAKIHAEIYAKFFPPADSVGKTAKVRLEINENGVLISFRVISYSSDELFNEAVDTCLAHLNQFAIHPDHKAISLDIILTAKD